MYDIDNTESAGYLLFNFRSSQYKGCQHRQRKSQKHTAKTHSKDKGCQRASFTENSRPS